MAEEPDPRSRRTSRPLWLVEGADLVDRRRGTLLLTVGMVAVAGALAAWLVPDVVPPTPLVGAAIGVAGVLLGLAAIVATDATEAIVRGPRHVGAAGGELVAVLPGEASLAGARPLAGAVVDARRPGQTLLLGLSAAGRDAAGVLHWVEELARALAEDGSSVLAVDLVSAPAGRPGLLEFSRGEHALPEVVRFEPALRLAWLAAGADRAAAIDAMPTLRGRLPRDLDVLLVALPPAANRQVVRATRALDHLLLVARRDETAKVDLIASLDAMDAVGTHAQVVLLDDRTASALSGGVPRVGAVGGDTSASTEPAPAVQPPPADGVVAAGSAPTPEPPSSPEPAPSSASASDLEVSTETASLEATALGGRPVVGEPGPSGSSETPVDTTDDDHEASHPRSVEVLLGAAAALGAASLLADEQGTGSEDGAERDDHAPLQRRPDLAVTTHLEPDAAAPSPALGSATVPSPVVPEVDPSPDLPPTVDPDADRVVDPEPDVPTEPDSEPTIPTEPDPGPQVPTEPDPEPEVPTEPDSPEPEPEGVVEPAPALDHVGAVDRGPESDLPAEPELEPEELRERTVLDLDDDPEVQVVQGPPVIAAEPDRVSEDTDRLPRVVSPEPALGDDGDDLLRTTAQLAVLLDDLQSRDGGHSDR